jgi:hypothetical protein
LSGQVEPFRKGTHCDEIAARPVPLFWAPRVGDC